MAPHANYMDQHVLPVCTEHLSCTGHEEDMNRCKGHRLTAARPPQPATTRYSGSTTNYYLATSEFSLEQQRPPQTATSATNNQTIQGHDRRQALGLFTTTEFLKQWLTSSSGPTPVFYRAFCSSMRSGQPMSTRNMKLGHLQITRGVGPQKCLKLKD